MQRRTTKNNRVQIKREQNSINLGHFPGVAKCRVYDRIAVTFEAIFFRSPYSWHPPWLHRPQTLLICVSRHWSRSDTNERHPIAYLSIILRAPRTYRIKIMKNDRITRTLCVSGPVFLYCLSFVGTFWWWRRWSSVAILRLDTILYTRNLRWCIFFSLRLIVRTRISATHFSPFHVAKPFLWFLYGRHPAG